jgi:hypothetical protein
MPLGCEVIDPLSSLLLVIAFAYCHQGHIIGSLPTLAMAGRWREGAERASPL